MSSVEEINSLAECLYANPDRTARQQAEGRLNTLTQENADIAPLKAIFEQSSNQYALLFAAQGVVAWFKANRKWLSDEQRYEVVVLVCGSSVQRVSLAGAPRHVVLALMTAYAKLTKLCFEKGNFLIEAATFALQLLYDTSTAYRRHVDQNGGCGTAGPAGAGGGGNTTGSSGATPAPQGGGGGHSSGSTPLPDGSASGSGSSSPSGYVLIRHSRQPRTQLSNEDERGRMYYIALVLLSTLVNEFSKYDSSKQQTYMNFSTHRRCSNNFRDECLLDFFTAAVAELEEVNYSSSTVAEVLALVKDIMTFDFMAITVDETEEALSSQFPSTWKDTLLAPRTQQVLWGQHAALPFPYCETLLTGLTSLCGIRRTFFDSTDDRVAYLDTTLGYLVNTMQLTDGRLKVPSYVSELGEACYRLVAPFGYRDLHLSSAFQPFINGVRAISLDVFRIPFGQPGSFTTATTLLNFWSRLATSRRTFSMSEESPKDLELISPELVGCFFEARMQSSSSRGGDGASGGNSGGGTSGNNGAAMEYTMESDEDFEATMDSILSQTDAVGNLAVLDHARTMEMLADYVNRTLGPSVLNSPSATAWLFYLAAGLVRHVLSAVEDVAVEASSMFFVFCVDCANHRRNSGGATVGSPLYSPFVERALLHFLTMTQSVLSSSRLHEALGTVVTNVFQSRTALFQFILNNTGHNIMRGVNGSQDEDSAQIIRESIELIRNACMDIPNSMLAELHLELPPVVELPLAQSPQTYKLRTNLHAMLWRLSSCGPYSTDNLVAFLQPVELCMQSTLSGGGGNDALYTAGWMRDLRGVVLSLRDVADGLSDFVEWVCDHASSFHECLSRPAAQSSMVIISFLRFLEELVTQIGGRYTLPCCTAHNSCGLLLFRHICTLMQSVIERCITEEHIQRVSSQGGGGMVDGAYEMMLKPLALSFSILRKCIQGGFVPLGAMYYYNDDTYDNMLLGLLRMVGVFPFIYFKDYSKASYAVVNMLRTVTEEFAFRPLTKLDASELEKVISFVVYLCEDVDTQTGTLLHGLSFLSFIAGLIREVKALSTQVVSPSMDARMRGTSGTPPPSPMQLPSFYASPSGRLSGTPGSIGGRSGGGGGRSAGPAPARSTRLARDALARTLEPFSSLWERLISVAMNVIVCQDRALSVSCAVVYPIFETHPPFWFAFVESFVGTYPERKQGTVREALSSLSHAAESQDKFFSEVFTFRQTMRNL